MAINIKVEGKEKPIKNFNDLKEFVENSNDANLKSIFDRFEKFGVSKDMQAAIKDKTIDKLEDFQTEAEEFLKGVGLKPLDESRTPLQEDILDDRGKPTGRTRDIIFHNGKELMDYLQKNENAVYNSVRREGITEEVLYNDFVENKEQRLSDLIKNIQDRVAGKSQENASNAKDMLRGNRNRTIAASVITGAAGLVLLDTLGYLSLNAIGGAAGNAALSGLTALGSGLVGLASIPIALTVPAVLVGLGAAYFVRNRKKIFGRDPEIANARINAKIAKLKEKEAKLDKLRESCPFNPGTPEYNKYMNKIKSREKKAQLKTARYMTTYMKKQVKEFESQEKKLRSPLVSEKKQEKIMASITKSKENMELMSTQFAKMQERAVKNQFKPVEGRAYADSLWQNKGIELKNIKDNFDPAKQPPLSEEEKKYIIALLNDIKGKNPRTGTYDYTTFDKLRPVERKALEKNGQFIIKNFNAIKKTGNPFVGGTKDFDDWNSGWETNRSVYKKEHDKVNFLFDEHLTDEVGAIKDKNLKDFRTGLDKDMNQEMEGNVGLGTSASNIIKEGAHKAGQKVADWVKRNSKTIETTSKVNSEERKKTEEFGL